MALVRLGRIKDLISVGEVARWLTGAPVERTAPAASALRPALPDGVKKKPPPPDGTAKPVELTEATLADVWAQSLGMVGTIHARELERGGLPAIFAPNTLVLRFQAAYNQSQEFCQESERLGRVESALQKITGQAWKLRLESIPGNGAAPQDPPVQPSAVRARRNDAEEAARSPVVRRAIEVTGARVVRVDEDFGTGPATKGE
jgi:hypothetical protein